MKPGEFWTHLVINKPVETMGLISVSMVLRGKFEELIPDYDDPKYHGYWLDTLDTIARAWIQGIGCEANIAKFKAQQQAKIDRDKPRFDVGRN